MTSTEIGHPASSEPLRWTWWRIIWNFALTAIGYIGPQIAVLVIAIVMAVRRDPDFQIEEWVEKAGSNGLILSIATIASAIVCIPLMRFLSGLAERHPWDFLAARRPMMKQVLLACGAMAVFVAASDGSNHLLGRPVVPKFMIDAYQTARWPLLLFVAVAIAAPILEELFFRGMLFGVLRARGWPVVLVSLVTSLVFALAHLQYDLHDMTFVLMMGLLMAGARARSGSVIPGIAMHVLANTVGFIEVLSIR